VAQGAVSLMRFMFEISNGEVLGVHCAVSCQSTVSSPAHLALASGQDLQRSLLTGMQILALSLSGCIDQAAMEQAALQEQLFLAPNRGYTDDSSVAGLNSNSSPSRVVTCGREPVGVYCFNYEGLVGSVNVRSKAFSISIPSGEVISDVAYYIHDCSVFVPDYSNYQL
ncbi:hypothetical protein FOZ63_018938, partial [Perkinsus olseni]